MPELTAELEKQNVVPVFIATGYPVGFFSPRKLDNLNDIKGGKWRTASFWHQAHLKNAGATPVRIQWGKEVTEALANGSLDGLMVNIDSAIDIESHKVAPNALVAPELWLGHVYLVVMNRDRWLALSDVDKAAIQHAAETVYPKLGLVMDQSYQAMIARMQHDGVKIRQLTTDELRSWEKSTDFTHVQDEWVAEQKEKDIPAEEVLGKLHTVMDKFR